MKISERILDKAEEAAHSRQSGQIMKSQSRMALEAVVDDIRNEIIEEAALHLRLLKTPTPFKHTGPGSVHPHGPTETLESLLRDLRMGTSGHDVLEGLLRTLIAERQEAKK